MRVDRRFVIGALPLGPLLTLVGYLVLMLSSMQISGAMLLALVCFPTALLLPAAALAALLRRDATRWGSPATEVAGPFGFGRTYKTDPRLSQVTWSRNTGSRYKMEPLKPTTLTPGEPP